MSINATDLYADGPAAEPLPDAVAALAVAATTAFAQATVSVEQPWARATVPNQSTTGAFMRLTAQKDVVLTGASSPVAGIVEVHEMWMDQGIMRMRPADRVPLKAGQTIELMFNGVRSVIKEVGVFSPKMKPQDELGPGTVRDITVLGPAAPSWKHGKLHVKGRGPRDTYG